MLLSKSEKFNVNYALKIVKIDKLVKHPNADRLMMFQIDGNNIITSNKTQEGDIVVYFPLLTQISSQYLHLNNEYRNKDLNSNPEEQGFFNDKGIVKPTKLRQIKSEGYIVPIHTLEPLIGGLWRELALHIGEEFDTVNGILLAEKYVVPIQRSQNPKDKNSKYLKKHESKLVEGQFRLHYDTEQFTKNLWNIAPESRLTITEKLHGTSFVASRVLCKRPLKWYEKALKHLGIKIQDTHYDNLYSSRKVIKNDTLNPNPNHYYKVDIWKKANDLIKDKLIAGETVYGEIVGYAGPGTYIQKDYDYGCADGEFKVFIYRITHTNSDGEVIELSYNQLHDRAHQLGVAPVPHIYSGYASQLEPRLDTDHDPRDWQERLKNTIASKWVNDADCWICTNKVPAEGVCVRIEGLRPRVYKYKNFRFLGLESDQLEKGISNIEDNQDG